MKKFTMNSSKTHLYGLLLLVVLGLACQTLAGGSDGATPEPTIVVVTPDIEVEVVPQEPEVAVEGPTPVPALADVLEEYPDLPRAHEEDPIYFEKDVPPPGGVHAPVWQNCGIYTEPIEAKHALHSLEHGAVWMTYDPELPEEEIAILQGMVSDQAYTLLSPFPELRTSVVIVAWGLRFQTDSVTDPRILEFLLTYQQGPQTPEPGATCQGGVGSPVSPGALGFSSS